MSRIFRLLPLLLCLPAVAMAQSRPFDLGAALDTVKNIAQSQSVGSMSEADEIAVGRDVAASTMGQYRLIRNPSLQRKLNKIGMWVAMQSSRPDLPWHFAAVESDSINAFAAPGGTIMITQGLLQLVGNEAELACVIGHEVGHVTHKHHLALLQKNLLAEAGTNAFAVYSKSGQDSGLRKQLLGEGKELFNRGLDRGAEREADEEGVLLVAKAGYDPGACLTFMQRLAAMKGGSSALANLYKTHPTAAERSTDISAALKRLQGATPGAGMRPTLELGALTSKR